MSDQTPLFQSAPHLHKNRFMTRDGVLLPVRSWLPPQTPRAILIGLHGFNDYSLAFQRAGLFFEKQGVGVLAYDQRHFGLSPQPGLWAGVATYVADLQDFTQVVRARYPGIPVYILGESMGGAISIVAMQGPRALPVDGWVLVAPAVWGRATMPWYQRGLLSLLSRTWPGLRLTGQGLGIKPSDNIEVLKGLSLDPWVIKGTRMDALRGLSDLMDAALAGGGGLKEKRVLLLYGERDEIIPKTPMQQFMRSLEPTGRLSIAIYPEGYHLLLRDLGAERPLRDIAAWLKNPDQPRPPVPP